MGFWLLAVGLLFWISLNIERRILGGNSLDISYQVKTAIQVGIVEPLRLGPNALLALYAQAALETGNFKSRAFLATNSLFNRHKGSGRGEWLRDAPVFYAGPGDADLRTYSDIHQSARDMAQLLSDPLYGQAFLALRSNNVAMYYDALGRAGFAADRSYAKNLQRTYASLV